jgi:HSF-type DNA-binding
MMAPATHEFEDGYDPLGLFFNDDDATGILDALACLDDCHPVGTKSSVAVAQNGVAYSHVPPSSNASAVVQAPPPPQQQDDQKKPCHPYFYYRDFSTLPDPDPSTPITAPGRIPNFPAKMYAILSRKDLSDIITWLPHGRSWKVLKPREFEVKVIPTYFEHSKFSSFIRQANGWGFRRIISKGADRNSYYHELFLRGKPHLIKLMRRPPPSSKPLADASTEPDFHAISAERPLPEIKEGDEATDAVARGNFPRQATYSFVPPPSYVPANSSTQTPAPAPTVSSSVPPPPAPAPAAAAPIQYTSAPQPMAQGPSPTGFGHAASFHNATQQQTAPLYQQQQQQQAAPVYHHQHHQAPAPQYHYDPQPAAAPAHVSLSQPSDVLAPSGPSIHPVESTDSLLELLNKPLPAPEMFGSHTFYPLLD